MNWTKILIAGVVAGIVRNLVDFVMHGMIMSATYRRHADVFTQEEGSPIWFFVVAITISIAAAALFARTRNSWGGGLRGGASFGFWAGMVAFFGHFYNPLVIDGFPYYLAWCWGAMGLIGFIVMGTVIGALYPKER